MTVDLIAYSHNPDANVEDQWDYGLLKRVFENRSYPHGVDINVVPFGGFASGDIGVFVIPARHNAYPEAVDAINEALGLFRAALVILIGDEEAVFPWREIRHPNARLWVMHPHPIKHADLHDSAYFFGTGYKEDTPDLLPDSVPDKPVLWSFTGQVTHDRRKQAANGLKKAMARAPGRLLETRAFSSGMSREDYMMELAWSQVAPCPAGPYTVDTFRFYEALEAGCYPIVDAHSSFDTALGYWGFVYDEFPFPTIYDWSTVGGYIESECAKYPRNNNVGQAWWMQQKWNMARRFECDIAALGGTIDRPRTTAIITISPVAELQEEILQQTLWSVKQNLNCPIILAFDGVREEQLHLRDAYDEFVRGWLWAANKAIASDVDILPVVSAHHKHQAGMTLEALRHVHTDTVLFLEHDTPLVVDCPIDWDACLRTIESGALDVLRFHHEALILPDHEHLMIDEKVTSVFDCPVRRTRQWSQRPHLAEADYYRLLLMNEFSPGAKCFIEDRMHSVAQSYPRKHRIGIYCPPETPDNIKRSYHLDGRGDQPKYSESQIF